MKLYKFTFLALLALSAQIVFAAPRSLSEARTIAQKFMSEKTGHRISDSALHLSNPTRANIDELPYYIFNDTESEGFVIVSGSDLMREVIGYSTKADIPENEELPDNLRSWLQWVAESALFLETHPEAALSRAELQAVTTAIEPLVETQWNQNPYYNKYCPPVSATDKTLCPTGCVATAAAQIVRYHLAKSGKVITGKGIKSYTHNGKNHSVNYAEQTYDYTKMPLSLSESSSDEEVDEVAKLCYHIGVGIQMDYKKSGSGAQTDALPIVLIDNLGFNSNYRQVQRNLYDIEEWNDLLLNELQSKRPIIYSGTSSTGGHCFVLDGIDSNGMYHVNWGWGGHSDGYFDINILRPSSVGTGATLSPDGYINYCSASVNLCFEDGVGEKPSPLYLSTEKMEIVNGNLQCGESLSINSVILYNLCPYDYTGELYEVLVGSKGIVQTTHLTNVESIAGLDPATGQYGGIGFNLQYPIPPDLADGDHQLWFAHKTADMSDPQLIRGTYPSLSYILLTVKGGAVAVSLAQYEANLSASNWESVSEEIVEATPTQISVTVTNSAAQTYAGKFYLTLVTSTGIKAATFEANEVPAIASGKSARLTFDVSFPSATTWTLTLTAKRQGVATEQTDEIEGSATFTAIANQTASANFEMTESLQILADGPISPNETFKARFALKNTGDEYNGQFGLQFFTSILLRDPKAEIYSPVSFGAATESTVELEFTMPELNEGVSYYVRGVYLKGDTSVPFDVSGDGVVNRATITAGTTALEDVTPTNANKSSKIYDINGMPTTTLKSGRVYISDVKVLVR